MNHPRETASAAAALESQLHALADPEYAAFQRKLMPNVPPETVLGVRTPVLRKFAKAFAKTPACAAFLHSLPHRYYEENNLHGFVLETLCDYDAALTAVNEFLPFVNNWATCDSVSPKVLGRYPERLLPQCRAWLQSEKTYTVRFGVGMLQRFFLDSNFTPEIPALVAAVQSKEYYVNMMLAWFFATAMAKQPAAILPYFTGNRLPVWVHNKAIQKCVESCRIPAETKTYLKTLKIKESPAR